MKLNREACNAGVKQSTTNIPCNYFKEMNLLWEDTFSTYGWLDNRGSSSGLSPGSFLGTGGLPQSRCKLKNLKSKE